MGYIPDESFNWGIDCSGFDVFRTGELMNWGTAVMFN